MAKENDFYLESNAQVVGAHPDTAPIDVVRLLNGLLAACHDAAYCFGDCAEQAQAPHLRMLFHKHAEECRRAALEIRTQVKLYGGAPDEGGTASGALHRGWLALRGTLSGYTDEPMLQECQRVQDALMACYAEAQCKQLPHELKAVLEVLQWHAKCGETQIKMARAYLMAQLPA